MSPALLLDYAGPNPVEHRPFLRSCWDVAAFIFIATIFVSIVILRAALLGAGFILIGVGTLLLYVGGRRSAGVTLSRWRARFADLMRLWIGDMMRPIRSTTRSWLASWRRTAA